MAEVRLVDHVRATQGLSSRAARQAMSSGKVFYRGLPTADAGRMVDPAQVRFDVNAPRLRVGFDPVLVHTDPHLAVIWKPAGLLSVAAPGRGDDDNLVSLAARMLGTAKPVHRLDEPTSGLMLVARTDIARSGLIEQISAHAIERRYLALVHQTFPEGEVRHASELRQGHAVSHFRRLQVLRRDASLVEARLETGRTHQIRIHLADLGHLALGDERYASPSVSRRARRLCLHAWRLAFTHPRTGERLCFEAPLADDLERLRRELDKPRDPDARHKPKRRDRDRKRKKRGRKR